MSPPSLEAGYGGHPPHLVSQRMAAPSEARLGRRMVTPPGIEPGFAP